MSTLLSVDWNPGLCDLAEYDRASGELASAVTVDDAWLAAASAA